MTCSLFTKDFPFTFVPSLISIVSTNESSLVLKIEMLPVSKSTYSEKWRTILASTETVFAPAEGPEEESVGDFSNWSGLGVPLGGSYGNGT